MLKRKYLWLILIFFVLGLLSLGLFLEVPGNPAKSDCIIVIAGDRGERLAQAVHLYDLDYAPFILISGGEVYHKTTIARLMRDHALELGVPENAIILEEHADSTYQNAVHSKTIVTEKGFNSAIVVTSNYHMRRTMLTFNKVFKDTPVKLTYSFAKDPFFNAKRWWSTNKGIMYTFTECVKLLGYALGRGM